jgi:hypothetical protein
MRQRLHSIRRRSCRGAWPATWASILATPRNRLPVRARHDTSETRLKSPGIKASRNNHGCRLKRPGPPSTAACRFGTAVRLKNLCAPTSSNRQPARSGSPAERARNVRRPLMGARGRRRKCRVRGPRLRCRRASAMRTRRGWLVDCPCRSASPLGTSDRDQHGSVDLNGQRVLPTRLDAVLVGAGSIGGAVAYLFERTPQLDGELDIVAPQPLGTRDRRTASRPSRR